MIVEALTVRKGADCLDEEARRACLGRDGARRSRGRAAAGTRLAAGTRGSSRLPTPIAIAASARCKPPRRSSRRTSMASCREPLAACNSKARWSNSRRGRATRRATRRGPKQRSHRRSSKACTSLTGRSCTRRRGEARRVRRRVHVPARCRNCACGTWKRAPSRSRPWPPELQNVRTRFTAGERRIEIQAGRAWRGRGERAANDSIADSFRAER